MILKAQIPEPHPHNQKTALPDSRSQPLLEEGSIEAFIRREVLPYTPDATKSSGKPKAGPAKSKARAVVPGSAPKVPAAIDEAALLGDLRTLVQSARQRIATAAHSTQTLLCQHCWQFDPAATAFYINAYRERWDGDEQGDLA